MLKIPKKVVERFAGALKGYQAVVADLKARDVSEADTVTVVKDILADVFGFNKYVELTSEQQIRGTFCDLAVKLDGSIRLLIEVKSAGTELNESHLRQAIDYGAREGITWVALTNAVRWRLYRITFGQPIGFEEVCEFSLLDASARNEDDVQRMFLLSREGFTDDAMDKFHQHAQLLNRFMIGQVVQSEAVVAIIRREMRRLFPDLKVDATQIADLLVNDVLKRDVVEGDKVKEAQQRIRKAANRLARAAAKREEAVDTNAADTAVVSNEDVQLA